MVEGRLFAGAGRGLFNRGVSRGLERLSGKGIAGNIAASGAAEGVAEWGQTIAEQKAQHRKVSDREAIEAGVQGAIGGLFGGSLGAVGDARHSREVGAVEDIINKYGKQTKTDKKGNEIPNPSFDPARVYSELSRVQTRNPEIKEYVAQQQEEIKKSTQQKLDNTLMLLDVLAGGQSAIDAAPVEEQEELQKKFDYANQIGQQSLEALRDKHEATLNKINNINVLNNPEEASKQVEEQNKPTEAPSYDSIRRNPTGFSSAEIEAVAQNETDPNRKQELSDVARIINNKEKIIKSFDSVSDEIAGRNFVEGSRKHGLLQYQQLLNYTLGKKDRTLFNSTRKALDNFVQGHANKAAAFNAAFDKVQQGKAPPRGIQLRRVGKQWVEVEGKKEKGDIFIHANSKELVEQINKEVAALKEMSAIYKDASRNRLLWDGIDLSREPKERTTPNVQDTQQQSSKHQQNTQARPATNTQQQQASSDLSSLAEAASRPNKLDEENQPVNESPNALINYKNKVLDRLRENYRNFTKAKLSEEDLGKLVEYARRTKKANNRKEVDDIVKEAKEHIDKLKNKTQQEQTKPSSKEDNSNTQSTENKKENKKEEEEENKVNDENLTEEQMIEEIKNIDKKLKRTDFKQIMRHDTNQYINRTEKGKRKEGLKKILEDYRNKLKTEENLEEIGRAHV